MMGRKLIFANMRILVLLFVFSSINATAQKIDSIYVHLYTDSLKKGTMNYINIDGLSNGHYIPLDTSHIHFQSSYGKFHGNNLELPLNCTVKRVTIKAILISNPLVFKEFVVSIKQTEDPPLKSEQEVLFDYKKKTKEKRKG